MDETSERDAFLATFDYPDIGAMQSRLKAQIFLRPTKCFPTFADGVAKSCFGRLGRFAHPGSTPLCAL